LLGLTAISSGWAAFSGPHLDRQGAATQLIVQDRPFLVLGGELGNSSGEPDYLRPFWPKLKALNLNTVLAPVSWELLEPVEGRFDFSTVDGLIRDARSNNLRLVLLWFGVWKNSMSTYVPGWVKRDHRRFPRCRDSAGRALEILSPFSDETLQADARAFRALLRHLRETDAQEQTVIMIQVENEIGMLPEARDRSPDAEKLFAGAVPPALLEHLARDFDRLAPELRDRWLANGRKAAGTWTEVFGTGPEAEEIFMAWHFARFAGQVAAAGKAEYPLPMYVNAALIRPGHRPGQYPSAGPLPHLFAVWRAAAPEIDLFAPDIYFNNFTEWARRYAHAGNPLFIPEARSGPDASVNGLYAIAGLDAMGFSPFGIETIDKTAGDCLAQSYDLLAQLAPLILAHQGRGTMAGLISEGPEQRQPQQVWLGGYVLHVSFERAAPVATAEGLVSAGGPGPAGVPAGGLVIATGPDEFLIGGTGLTTTFQVREPGGPEVGLLSVEEGRFVDGRWTHLRWLNGDQTHQGRHVRLEAGRFGLLRVKLYTYR
jgi:beta-galactosidase GanA